MKIQHYAIIFIIIILPFSIVCKSRINNKIDTFNNEVLINNSLDVATMDAVDTLITLNQMYYGLYEGQTVDITPDIAKEAIGVFFDSLSVNNNLPFVSGDQFAEHYFSPYIPAILVIAYDGFYIYSIEENSSYEYVLSPKIPYAYKCTTANGDYYIHFSLGSYLKLYTPDGILYEGELSGDFIDYSEGEYKQIHNVLGDDTLEYLPQLTDDMSLIIYALEEESLNSVPEFLRTMSTDGKPSMLNDYAVGRDYSDVSEFHRIRREVIIDLITDTLNEKMNNHNRYADIMGITYNFYLPKINDSVWINSIDDVSIMSFVQGIPTGYETFYNSYALGSSRIVRRDFVYGTEEVDAAGNTVYLYHKKTCSHLAGEIDDEGYPVEGSTVIKELFISNESAVKAEPHAYYPCLDCKP